MSGMYYLLDEAEEKFNFPEDWDGEDVKCFAMRHMINTLDVDYFDEWECDALTNLPVRRDA